MKLPYILLLALLFSGCSYFSIKSDDLNPAAIEKNVNASTRSVAGQSELIASYTTKYDENSGGRAHNIKLAANKLKDTAIEPGGTFSYNKCIGPTGQTAGFKKARIFVNGKDAEGYGGGVCQVSSTLYNTVLKAGLTVIERHPHSKKVRYVPENKDAATSYGSVDFKFKNDTEYSIIIKASAGNGQLTVDLLKQV